MYSTSFQSGGEDQALPNHVHHLPRACEAVACKFAVMSVAMRSAGCLSNQHLVANFSLGSGDTAGANNVVKRNLTPEVARSAGNEAVSSSTMGTILPTSVRIGICSLCLVSRLGPRRHFSPA